MPKKYTRAKVVYRDVETGRLLPKKVADERDPGSYVSEELLVDLDVDGDPFGRRSTPAQPLDYP